MQKLRVLVVDDVGSIRKIWDKILVDEVFEKSFANDGREGLKLYKSSKPDIVLLDVYMPEMTGYSVLKEIREEIGDKATTIVMQTTISEKDDIMKCVKLGIQGYIIKPFDENEVVSKVFKAYEATNPAKAQAARKAMEKVETTAHLVTPLEKEEGGGADPSCTDEEKEYLEEIKFCLEKGEISEDVRRILERLRVKLNISEERGKELEGLAAGSRAQ